MPATRAIRRRINAVRNIRTVTHTMEMVASARRRKADALVSASRPHTDRMTDLVGDLLARSGPEQLDHPLLHEGESVKRELIIVITPDRGLCGGLVSSVMRLADERRRQLAEAGYEFLIWASGTKGLGWLRFRRLEVDRILTGFGFLPTHELAGALAEEIISDFLAGRISGLEVAYMQYISRARQEPAIAQVLPMKFIEPPRRFSATAGEPTAYEFMPSAQEVLRNLLPATVRMRLWQCFLDAGISEHAMRASSMRNATDNADDMIKDLTLTYNRMRQAQITAELAEIMGGRETLE